MRSVVKNIFVVWVAIALGAMPFVAHADEAKERENLIEKSEALVGKILGEVKGFARDSSAQDVTDAVKLSLELAKQIGALKKVQGDDGAATEMTATWPGQIKGFQGASINLAKLKNEQLKFGSGSNAYVPLNCKAQADDLKAVINKFLPNKDPDGLTDIPATAKKVGAFASAALSRARTTAEAAKDWTDAVEKFSGRGVWDAVSDAMKAEAKAIETDVLRKQKDLESSCEKIAKGDKNPDVIAARKAIAEEMGEDFAELQKAVDKWEVRAASYFKLDCEAMKNLHKLYCDADTGDADSANDLKKFHQETGRLTGTMKREFDAVMKELQTIIAMRKKLEQEDATKKQAQKVYGELDDELKKMNQLKDKGSIKGMSLPVVQYYIKFGKEMHAKMERRFSCNVRDVAYPGGRERPDCVSAKACYIYEFKPNSSSAVSKGRGQLSTHKRLVEGYYSDVVAGKKSISSKYGGKAILAEFEKSGCIKNGKFAIKTDVKTYARCDEKYQCVR